MKTWKIVVGERVLDFQHKTYKSAIFAAQVLRGMGSRKVKVLRGETMKMILLAVVLGLTLSAVASAKDESPADYPLTATVLSLAKSTNSASGGSIMNPATGHIVGFAHGWTRTDDSEAIQIGTLLYITRIAGHAGKAIRNHRLKPLQGKAGQSFPAQLDAKKQRINLLVDGDVVHLEIMGQQVAQ